jgi:hypothetical protein
MLGEPGSAGKSSNTGVIVGAVVGIVVFFAILALVLYYLCVYKPKKRRKNSLRLADPLFLRSHGNYSGSASDKIHSCQNHYLSKAISGHAFLGCCPGQSSRSIPIALSKLTSIFFCEFSPQRLQRQAQIQEVRTLSSPQHWQITL